MRTHRLIGQDTSLRRHVVTDKGEKWLREHATVNTDRALRGGLFPGLARVPIPMGQPSCARRHDGTNPRQPPPELELAGS
jgi:hypothetical protein